MKPSVMERRALQVCIVLAASVAVLGGLGGMLRGAAFFGLAGGITADSHARYLSGLLFAIGLGFWSTVPRIEAQRQRLQTLAAIVVTGGLVRSCTALAVGMPHGSALFALLDELVMPVALVLWQRRIARAAHGP